MHQEKSKYADHPRITWFGHGGTVAYVDYTGATTSYFIGGNGAGGFKVIPPNSGGEYGSFATIDDGIEYALGAAGPLE
jgi:hypothetical protein